MLVHCVIVLCHYLEQLLELLEIHRRLLSIRSGFLLFLRVLKSFLCDEGLYGLSYLRIRLRQQAVVADYVRGVIRKGL